MGEGKGAWQRRAPTHHFLYGVLIHVGDVLLVEIFSTILRDDYSRNLVVIKFVRFTVTEKEKAMSDNSPSMTPTTQDERVMAALAHATAILPFWGTLGAIAIWAIEREKSRYAAFQALQAVVYHLVVIVAFFFFGICFACFVFVTPLSMLMMAPGAESRQPGPLFFAPLAFPVGGLALIALFWLFFVIYGIVGAVAALQGQDFRYFIIGDRVESYLARS
jgi:uncharacterized Tic20 family protein